MKPFHRLSPLGISVWACGMSMLTLVCFPGLAAATVTTPDDVLTSVNELRDAHLLPALNPDPVLTEIATERLDSILNTGTLSHQQPDGLMAWDLAESRGYSYIVIGENLAEGYASPSEITAAWLKSANHRANMLNPAYTQSGIAVGTGNNGYIVVQMYAHISTDINFQKSIGSSEPDGVSSISKYPLIEHDSVIRINENHKPVDILKLIQYYLIYPAISQNS